MEKVQFPRFMVAAEKSGQGKTLITCALLELLKEQHRVSAFKWARIISIPCSTGGWPACPPITWTVFFPAGRS